ncbi:viral A-type inclusion protein [Reticulomyxa filosa]|uniref:Viral A-type inclusion protein n=1 Tax=Reticulomyxa filosa TaxID=46433 RepID=X6NW85_RETFI|nr:viral A-type inclusion protein [Reticulomyxa filosa]|eukprot:ETO30570.1 viral A-type inclusion protein [Reticulomyxa filosa]
MQLNTLVSEIEKVKSQMNTQNKNYHGIIEKMYQRINECKQSLENYQRQYHTQLSNTQIYLKEIEQLKSQTARSGNQIQLLQNENLALKRQITQANKNVSQTFEDEKRCHTQTIEQYKQSLTQRQTQVNAMRQELDVSRQELIKTGNKKLKDENLKLRQLSQDMLKSIKFFQQNNSISNKKEQLQGHNTTPHFQSQSRPLEGRSNKDNNELYGQTQCKIKAEDQQTVEGIGGIIFQLSFFPFLNVIVITYGNHHTIQQQYMKETGTRISVKVIKKKIDNIEVCYLFLFFLKILTILVEVYMNEFYSNNKFSTNKIRKYYKMQKQNKKVLKMKKESFKQYVHDHFICKKNILKQGNH